MTKKVNRKVDNWSADVEVSWEKPNLLFKTFDTEYEDSGVVKVVITHPYELTEIRAQLTKIEDYWKKRLAQL